MSQNCATGLLGHLRTAISTIAILVVPLVGQTAPPSSPPPDSSTLVQFLGREISAVHFRQPGSQEQDFDQYRQSLPLKAGDLLTRTGLHDCLQALYSTGRFATIEVMAEAEGDKKIAITFSTMPYYFVGQLSVTGEPRPPTANQLANATKLELGQLFTREGLHQGIARMTKVMEDNGYYESTITSSLDFNRNTQQVQISFQIVRGPHARVGKVTVKGDTGYTEAEILNIAKLHPGDYVTTARLTRALNRLRKKYQKKGRLEAQVAVVDRIYVKETDKLDYGLTIQRGPVVEINVEGASIRRGLIKKYVPVYEENAVDDDLLNEGRRNLRDFLQTQGYFDAEVDYTRKDSADKQVIVYDVNRGKSHKFSDLVIEGNKYFGEESIRERMQVVKSSLLVYHGIFSQAILAHDTQAIENLYRNNGFQQVKVVARVEDDFKGDKGRIRVIVHIDEGPQTLVGEYIVEGNLKISTDQLPGLNTALGQPYSDTNLASDRNTILNFYFNRGFPEVKFEAFAEPLPGNPPRMKVRFKINEGDQKFVDQVLVTGLHFTHPFVVQRELQIHPGDPLSQASILETQRRLYDLGIFNEVNIAVQNPTGESKEKNVIVQVDEGKRYTFNYGFGFEVQTGDPQAGCTNTSATGCKPQGRMGASPRVSFDVTRNNFLGRNHTVLFKSRFGRLQQRALISYEAPTWFNRDNMKLTFTTFFDKTQDVRTFTAERLEGSVQLQHIWSKSTTLLYRIAYRRVQVDPTTLQVQVQDIPLLSKPVRVGLPSITYIRDTRHDPIDSKDGTYTTADFGVASRIFGSESQFARLLMQNSSYYTFKKKWVFARSTRIGFEAPYGGVKNKFVPLPERFFLGGATTHRGFAINQAGPRDLETGFPLGGEAVFLNNFELRTPSITLPFLEDSLSAVIFHDAGNVFTSVDEFLKGLVKVRQKSPNNCRNITLPASCDFNYISHAIGAGLRYRTPIGPVRVDFGYNLNPPVFAVRTPVSQARSETLKRWNFSFSIGQTF